MKFSSNVFSAILVVLCASNRIVTSDAAAACQDPYANIVNVKCTAQDGETEKQFPKDTSLSTYAAPGTKCEDIQIPEEIHWRECLRTIQFDFEWEYIGPDDAKLGSIHREITNNLGEFPEERVAMLESYWGETIYTGWGLENTYKQMVVDLCDKPITYTYSLDVALDTPGNQKCVDTASYEFAVTGDFTACCGYEQFKGSQSAEEVDLEPSMEALNIPSDPTSSAAILKRGLGVAALLVASLLM